MKFELYKPAQADEVKELFTNVFSDSEGQEEGKLIGNLVSELLKTTDLSDIFTFIAKDDKEIIIGCIIFTRIIFEIQVNAFILSPVAISTQHQNRGFGQKLINFGIDYLKNKSVEIVFTYGDPSFYSKVGFQNISEEIVKAPLKLTYPEGWLAQSLISKDIKSISGDSTCVSALNKQQYW